MSAIQNLASDAETQTTDEAADSGASSSDDIDFYANETADLYLTFGDGWATQHSILEALGMETPDLSVQNLGRGDLDIVMKKAEREGWTPQQTLWVVTGAIKSWLGTRQRKLNDGFGIGLTTNDDGVVEGWYEGGYAEAFGETLPTIEWEYLSDDEVADLEAIGVDVDDLGYHPDDTPRLPVFGGERLPVAVETMADVEALVEAFEALPENPSLGDEPFETEADPDVVYDPSSGTIGDLEAFVGQANLSEGDLEAILAAERSDKDRKGAKEVLRDAIDATGNSGSKSRYTKAEEGTIGAETEDAPEPVDATGDDAERMKDKAEAVATLIEAGYDRDEAREMVFGE